jgi:S1/P1 nuclease
LGGYLNPEPLLEKLAREYRQQERFRYVAGDEPSAVSVLGFGVRELAPALLSASLLAGRSFVARNTASKLAWRESGSKLPQSKALRAAIAGATGVAPTSSERGFGECLIPWRFNTRNMIPLGQARAVAETIGLNLAEQIPAGAELALDLVGVDGEGPPGARPEARLCQEPLLRYPYYLPSVLFHSHDHPGAGPWHYIDIPLADSKIDLARECPNGDCVIAKTQQYLAVLKDPNGDRKAKAQALKFVIHFVGDLHQPLHDEDNGDKGGNTRHVIFDGHLNNLHWLWNTGLLQHINRNPAVLAAVRYPSAGSDAKDSGVSGPAITSATDRDRLRIPARLLMYEAGAEALPLWEETWPGAAMKLVVPLVARS